MEYCSAKLVVSVVFITPTYAMAITSQSNFLRRKRKKKRKKKKKKKKEEGYIENLNLD